MTFEIGRRHSKLPPPEEPLKKDARSRGCFVVVVVADVETPLKPPLPPYVSLPLLVTGSQVENVG